MTAKKLRELADKLESATMESYRRVQDEVEMDLRKMLLDLPPSKE
jgi:hypothetical protein